MGKINFGLSNVHYSIYTPAAGSTAASFGTPVAMPGAVSLSLDVEGDENDFYADNSKWFSQKTNNGYTGELELAYVDDDLKKALLGYRTVTTGSSESAVTELVEVADAKFAEFALMFQIDSNQDGHKAYVFYKCTLDRPSVSAETTSESITPSTTSLPITIVPFVLASGDKIVNRAHVLTASDTWFSTAPAIPTLDTVA